MNSHIHRLIAHLFGVLGAILALACGVLLASISIRYQVIPTFFANPYVQLLEGFPFGIILLRAARLLREINERALVIGYAVSFAIGWIMFEVYVRNLAR